MTLLFCLPASGKLIGGFKGVYYKPSREINMIEEKPINTLKGLGIELGWKSKFLETNLDVNWVKGSSSYRLAWEGSSKDLTASLNIYQFTPRLLFAPKLKGMPIEPLLGLGIPYYFTIEEYRYTTEKYAKTYNPNPPIGIEPFIGINYSPLRQLGLRFEMRDQFARPSDDWSVRGLRFTAGIYLNTL